MATRNLDPEKLGQHEDWEGNNAVFRCPVCQKVFIVSGQIHKGTDGQHGYRECPKCGKSGGWVSIQWDNRIEPQTNPRLPACQSTRSVPPVGLTRQTSARLPAFVHRACRMDQGPRSTIEGEKPHGDTRGTDRENRAGTSKTQRLARQPAERRQA